MIKFPTGIERTIAEYTGKAQRQLLWPRGNVLDHIEKRQFIADELIQHVKGRVRCIVDIGCGLAVLTAILAKQLSIRDIHLFDGDGSVDLHDNEIPDSAVYDKTMPWANVDFGNKIVTANASGRVYSHLADEHPVMRADLIVSMRALTYHFPLIEYITRINSWLRVGGYIFLETKRDVDLIDLAERCGLNLSMVYERRNGKCKLVLCRRI